MAHEDVRCPSYPHELLNSGVQQRVDATTACRFDRSRVLL